MWIILCSDEGAERIYPAFSSCPGASVSLSSPDPPTFGEGDSTNSPKYIWLCECVCEKRVKREGVGYQSETSLL